MTDDHFAWWNRKPPPPRKPKPGEWQWTLWKGTERTDCEFRLTIGCEAQLFKNGEIVIGQLFATRAQAEQWAEQQRQRLQRQGWQTDPAAQV